MLRENALAQPGSLTFLFTSADRPGILSVPGGAEKVLKRRARVKGGPLKEKTLDQLGRIKRGIMETVWELGEGTVRQIRIRIDPQKEMAYTTFLSSMQQLEQAGWLRHYRKKRANVYQPMQDQWQARLASLRSFLQRAFKDDPMLLFQALFEIAELSRQELDQIEKMLHEHRTRLARTL